MLRHNRYEEKFQLNYASCRDRADHIHAVAGSSYSIRGDPARDRAARREAAGNQPFFTITWRTTV